MRGHGADSHAADCSTAGAATSKGGAAAFYNRRPSATGSVRFSAVPIVLDASDGTVPRKDPALAGPAAAWGWRRPWYASRREYHPRMGKKFDLRVTISVDGQARTLFSVKDPPNGEMLISRKRPDTLRPNGLNPQRIPAIQGILPRIKGLPDLVWVNSDHFLIKAWAACR